jgi:hypothetical protein
MWKPIWKKSYGKYGEKFRIGFQRVSLPSKSRISENIRSSFPAPNLTCNKLGLSLPCVRVLFSSEFPVNRGLAYESIYGNERHN